ncbi:MAG: T9SS type A sorting domain-containing protein [bacterium]
MRNFIIGLFLIMQFAYSQQPVVQGGSAPKRILTKEFFDQWQQQRRCPRTEIEMTREGTEKLSEGNTKPAENVKAVVHTVPFGSSDNTIELTVVNETRDAMSNIEVRMTEHPEWVKCSSISQTLALLKPHQELSVSVIFAVDKSAAVASETKLKFTITTNEGSQWEKEIAIKVSPPETFELFQNYPNPFNPSTTIAYQLSKEAHINLRIFNMLGQQVTTLVDAERLAGYFKETFDASHYASGAYVYVLTTTENSGSKQIARKAMMLVK